MRRRVPHGLPSGNLIWVGAVAGFSPTRRRVEAFIIGISLGIWIPKTIIKHIVASPRPSDDLVAIHEVNAGFGFSSRHMTAGVASWVMLAVVAIVLLALASLNRIDSGAHWPIGVLGGLLLGGIWLGFTAVDLRLRRLGRRGRRKRGATSPLMEPASAAPATGAGVSA